MLFSSVFAITETKDMGQYEVPSFYIFVVFWDRDYVSQLSYVRDYVVVKSILSMIVINASLRGSMCFMCLIFSLSGPCELLFLLCFIASWTRGVVSVMLYPCMF